MNLIDKQALIFRAMSTFVASLRAGDINARLFSEEDRRRLGIAEPVVPSASKSAIVEIGGLSYVRLMDDAGKVSAVYRITTADKLKLLKRWPAGIETAPTAH